MVSARNTTKKAHQLERNAKSYAALSERTGIPASTLWHRAHGRPSKQQNAANQQYLTPQEEKALLDHALRMANNGYPLPVKSLCSLALVIARRRSSNCQAQHLRPPGKNWPQGFYKRHPELKARKLKTIDICRDDRQIEEKMRDWFVLIRKELDNPVLLPENVYNMDETGVLLSVLNSLKVLVSRDDLRKHRAVTVKRTLVTAIECISADGKSLHPLIIWPAATHRSSWTSHPTPGWHYACSSTGYTDTNISLYWVRSVFDPQTRAQANGRPRLLISDGFGTHESLELMKYCFENQIILCRLPSHTTHKLQPCDVGVFGPLKTAYREQVERLYRGGAGTVDKRHFTYLYDRARQQAITKRNISSAWSKCGLFPFNPTRVLKETKLLEPRVDAVILTPNANFPYCDELMMTPVSSSGVANLRTKVEEETERLDFPGRQLIQKLTNAAEKAFAERSLLLDDNRLLFEQNNERVCRQSAGSRVSGTAKVISYEDIVEAERRRDAKAKAGPRLKGQTKKQGRTTDHDIAREIEMADSEISKWGLDSYCSVLQF